MGKVLLKIMLLLLITVTSITYVASAIDSDNKYALCKQDKVLYLTFDDGPSPNTTKILDILNRNNVKATFFVIGNQVQFHKDIVKQLESSGMCILPHTDCHNYRKIYNSTEDYFIDLNSCIIKIKDVILKEPINFVRFPGGVNNELLRSDILDEIKSEFLDNKYYFIEWNVYGLDAESVPKDSNVIYESTINQLKNNPKAIILLHDGYGNINTANSLERIIVTAKELGYKFKTLEEITEKDFDYFVRKNVINKK